MIWPLQILRFVAALMVVYVHAAQQAVAQTGSYDIFPRELPPAVQDLQFTGAVKASGSLKKVNSRVKTGHDWIGRQPP